MKRSNGITLVALIITIIVLLILAVVTIAAVNEGKLFEHANNAAKIYSEKAEEENALLSEIFGDLKKGNKQETSQTENSGTSEKQFKRLELYSDDINLTEVENGWERNLDL